MGGRGVRLPAKLKADDDDGDEEEDGGDAISVRALTLGDGNADAIDGSDEFELAAAAAADGVRRC